MQINNTFLQNFSFSNNFGNIFDKSPNTLTKVEQAIQPLVSKYGATDNNDLSNVTKASQTSMQKLQDDLITEDETISALDFVDENGDGVEDIDDSLTSMESILNGITDEEDLQGIQDELMAMMDSIDKIAQKAFGEIAQKAENSSGITALSDNSYLLSIGDSELEIDIMSLDSESLGLREIDVTKEGGIEEAIGIIENAQKSIVDGLQYLTDVKQEIYDTFDSYKTQVEDELGFTHSSFDDMLAQLKDAIVNDSTLALLAQSNQKPETVLALA